jgi:hypothetical protein
VIDLPHRARSDVLVVEPRVLIGACDKREPAPRQQRDGDRGRRGDGSRTCVV